MLWTVAVILLVRWALGMVSSYTAGGLVDLLLVIAVIVIVSSSLAAADPSDGAAVRCAVGLTPPPHEVPLYDENAEPIDFDTDDVVVGITGFVVHTRRSVTCGTRSWLPERCSP